MFTLIIVTGGPEDETLWAGGVIARYAEEGMRVVCVTCTGGEHGSIVAPELDTPENRARLGEIRAEELTRALARLGSIENRWLGLRRLRDDGLPQNTDPHSFWSADPKEATGRLVRIVRQVQPDVIVTFNEWGGNGHPDHIRAALIAGRRSTAPATRRPTPSN
jgi:N-acetyl-1-D-myo-inositol-2-amino-2-deoxy-alpha-D-glucopyranoside deacetylase